MIIIKLVVGKIADAALEGLGARKEEIIEEEVRTIARAGVEEAELSDEELLGEATLAKLVSHPKGIPEIEIEALEEEKGEEFDLAEEEVAELIGEEDEASTEEDEESEEVVSTEVDEVSEEEEESEETEEVSTEEDVVSTEEDIVSEENDEAADVVDEIEDEK